MSDQSSPTDKSKAHLVAVYRDTHREESTTNSTMSTKILLKPPIECAPMKWTGRSPERTLNNDYWVNVNYQCLSAARYALQSKRSTAQSSDSASALELGKYNHLLRSSLDRCQGMGQDYMIDVDDWWWLKVMTDAGSGSSHQCQVMSGSSYHPDDSNKDLSPDGTSYACDTGWQVECCMSSGVGICRNWGPRLGSGHDGSMEIWNSGLEEVINWAFLSSISLFSSLRHILLHWILVEYKWRWHGL